MEPSQLDALLKFLIDTLKESKDFTIDQAGVALIAGTLGAQWLGGLAEEDEGKEFGQKVRRRPLHRKVLVTL